MAASPNLPQRQASPIWQMILIILAIVLLMPGLMQTFRGEVSGWLHARGFEAELNENLEVAESLYRRSLAWDAQNPYADRSLTSLLVRTGRAEETLAAAEAELTLARAQYESHPNGATRAALISALNLSAYFCGLANTDLERALAQINEAIDLSGQPTEPYLLDTRGYVLWRLGRQAEALHEMNLAVDTNKHRYRADHRIAKQRRTFIVDERVTARQLKAIDEKMATFYYHRALVNQALGKDELAQRDMDRVKNLGFDPAEGLY
ncbi:MAG: hypothetical protein AAGF97_09750 [Planctomycetota bacterium]